MITLTHIARGGIFDHVGGGFCRYSTDARWMIPHFEKMLYDNGALLGVYADALAIGPDPLFEQRGAANRRMADARDAASARRLFQRDRRRFRRRRRQVLRLAPRRNQTPAVGRRISARRNAVRSRQAGELRRQMESASQRCVARGHRTSGVAARTKPTRCSRAREQSCSSRAANAFRPARTTKCSPRGTASRSAAWRKPVSCSTNRSGSNRRRAPPISSRRRMFVDQRAAVRDVAQRTSATSRVSRRLRESARQDCSRCCRCVGAMRTRASRNRWPTPWWRVLRQRRRRLLLHRATITSS